MNKIRKLTYYLAALFIMTGACISLIPKKATALSGSEFNAANIIGDNVFFNSDTMDSNNIQAFLNAKVPVCDTWHAAGGGYSPPFTCLKDYTQAVPNAGGDSYCAYMGGNGTVYSAAQIIYIVSKSCGINPQVLLVLLQKEQSLITDTWPWPIQYRSATGYGCPDTAACDSQYYGFFNQVYNAARQFNRYVQQPQLFNYAVGRTSYIPYQANRPDCGGTNVTIQNKATAALYNYTPYQPNAAALANLYGTGDGCSAYGNRNFWRMFSDWFGPTSGDLLRTVNNGTVYLVSGDTKYPIASMGILEDYSNLGPIRYVGDDFLNSKITGQVLGRMVQSPDLSLYFVNASIKLPFTSCSGDVVDYGFTCAEGQFARITQEQSYKLASGPAVTKLILSTGTGTVYLMEQGKKHPITGWDDLLSLHIPITWNVLTERMLSDYPNGNLIFKPGSLVKSPSSGTVYVVKDRTTLFPISSFVFASEMGLASTLRTMPNSDLASYTIVSSLANKIACGGQNYLATGGTSYPVTAGEMTVYGYNSGQFLDGGSLCSNITTSTRSLGRYLRSNSGSIYYVNDLGQKQAFTSYSNYINHQALNGNPGYIQSGDYFISTVASGTNI